jgi:hypothetical protein
LFLIIFCLSVFCNGFQVFILSIFCILLIFFFVSLVLCHCWCVSKHNKLGSFCLDDHAIWCRKWATNFPKTS